MKCIKCGRPVGASRYCNACGFDNKHIAKALNTAIIIIISALKRRRCMI